MSSQKGTAVILFCLFFFSLQVHGLWGFGKDEAKVSPYQQYDALAVASDSTSSYVSLSDHRFSQVFDNAAKVLRSLSESYGICSKVVASSLLENCDALDLSYQNYDQEIEDVRTQFASLLALCEMKYDDSNWPTECKAVSRPGKASHDDLSRCFRWIHADGNRWTSYSNSREMSHMVCEASRRLMETERVVRTQAQALSTAGDVGTALKQLLADYETKHKDAMAFSEAIIKLKDDVLHQMEGLKGESRSWVENLQQHLQAMIAKPLDIVVGSIDEARERLGSVNNVIDQTSDLSIKLRATILENHGEYSRVQFETFRNAKDDLAIVQNSIQTLSVDTAPTLVQALEVLANQTANNHALNEQLHQQVVEIHQRLEETRLSQENMQHGIERSKLLVVDLEKTLLGATTLLSYIRGFVSYLWNMRILQALVSAGTISVAGLAIRFNKLQAVWTMLVIGALWYVLQCASAVFEDLGWIPRIIEPTEEDNMTESMRWLLGSTVTLLLLLSLRTAPRSWVYGCAQMLCRFLEQFFNRPQYRLGIASTTQSSSHNLATLDSNEVEETDLLAPLDSRQLRSLRSQKSQRPVHPFLDRGSRFQRGESAPPSF